MKSVVIVGGGVVGLAIAAGFARKGIQVTVVEKSGVGSGCSYGNAGWMTPCFAMPLPRPGMILKSLGWMMDPSGPLYIQPRASLDLLRWLSRFLLSTGEKNMRRSAEALIGLSKVSLQEYERLNQKWHSFGFEKRGLLMVSKTQAGIHSARAEMNLVSEFQIPGRALSADEVRSLEPAVTGDVLGGVYFPDEAHGEPLAVVETLRKEAESFGAKVLENTAVLSFEVSRDRVVSVHTSKGVLSAENFVLATGTWSKELARQLRLRVPILGGKGYSMILPKLNRQPKIPLMFIERKIGITPRADSLRLAGSLELVDQDFSVTKTRVQAILKGASEVLEIPQPVQVSETWCGLRPCTPDGVPLLGWSPKQKNLLLACGHQMLGLQSATGSARWLSDLIEGVARKDDIQTFNPGRF